MRRVLKSLFVFFIFVFLGLFNKVSAQEVKFIFLTDAGVNTKNAYMLQETIKEINSYNDVDFVVFGGNNIQKPNIDNLNYFLYLFKKVKKPAYVLLGNQDVLSTTGVDIDYYMKRVRKASFFRHSKKPNYVFKTKGYLFVVMCGAKQYFQSSNGYYSKKELDWLEKVLESNKNEKIVILQHFPILKTKSQWLETGKYENYIELLEKYKNVKVIVSGHYDSNLETIQNNINYILVENYLKNQAYKIIQINLDEDFIGTYLVK